MEFPWTELTAALGAAITAGIATALSKLRKLLNEFKPNGGTSMRDAINRIENVAAANTGRIQALAADTSRAVWEASADGRCTFMNRTGLRWVKRTMSELRGNGWLVTIHPDDLGRIRRMWSDCVKSERAFEASYRLIDSQGEAIPITAHSHPLRDSRGTIVGWLGICERPGAPNQT